MTCPVSWPNTSIVWGVQRERGRKDGELFFAIDFILWLTGAIFSSVTLVGEADRKMLKAAIKHSSGEDQVRHRHVPPEAVVKWSQKLRDLKDEIAGVLQEEKEEKQVCSPVILPCPWVALIDIPSCVQPRWNCARAKI